MNWDNVCTFLSVAGSEFQRGGAMKLKGRCPNDLRFRFGILSSFSLEDRRERDGSHGCREMKKDEEVKTLQMAVSQCRDPVLVAAFYEVKPTFSASVSSRYQKIVHFRESLSAG